MTDIPERRAPAYRLKDIVARHIERYATRVAAALRERTVMGGVVNLTECLQYLDLWLDMVKVANCDVRRMTDTMRGELRDAVNDEYRVHRLKEGVTFCGHPWLLMNDDPRNIWVSYDDNDYGFLVNCKECLEVRHGR